MKECPDCHRCFEDPDPRCSRDGARLLMVLPGPCLLDGKYLLRRRLGAGGMGIVYEARDVECERRVAVKVLRPHLRATPRFTERFRREAGLLARIRHPHVVKVDELAVEARRDLAYLVMEHLEGTPLSQLLPSGLRLDADRVLVIADQVAAALDQAHRCGVVHCDLKPSNVLVLHAAGSAGRLPEKPEVKLIDFGVARQIGELAGSDSAACSTHRDRASWTFNVGTLDIPPGTPAYMAPEMFEQEGLSAAADIYGFGILLYELVTGSRPFTGSADELAMRHLSCRPPPPSTCGRDIDRKLDRPLLALLAKSPAERPATASMAVAALRAAYQRLERRRRWPRRLVAAIHLAVGTVVLSFVL